eukprot:scaffold86885_cov26-Tisochrysis_lutea.AAC.5
MPFNPGLHRPPCVRQIARLYGRSNGKGREGGSAIVYGREFLDGVNGGSGAGGSHCWFLTFGAPSPLYLQAEPSKKKRKSSVSGAAERSAASEGPKPPSTKAARGARKENAAIAEATRKLPPFDPPCEIALLNKWSAELSALPDDAEVKRLHAATAPPPVSTRWAGRLTFCPRAKQVHLLADLLTPAALVAARQRQATEAAAAAKRAAEEATRAAEEATRAAEEDARRAVEEARRGAEAGAAAARAEDQAGAPQEGAATPRATETTSTCSSTGVPHAAQCAGEEARRDTPEAGHEDASSAPPAESVAVHEASVCQAECETGRAQPEGIQPKQVEPKTALDRLEGAATDENANGPGGPAGLNPDQRCPVEVLPRVASLSDTAEAPACPTDKGGEHQASCAADTPSHWEGELPVPPTAEPDAREIAVAGKLPAATSGTAPSGTTENRRIDGCGKVPLGEEVEVLPPTAQTAEPQPAAAPDPAPHASPSSGGEVAYMEAEPGAQATSQPATEPLTPGGGAGATAREMHARARAAGDSEPTALSNERVPPQSAMPAGAPPAPSPPPPPPPAAAGASSATTPLAAPPSSSAAPALAPAVHSKDVITAASLAISMEAYAARLRSEEAAEARRKCDEKEEGLNSHLLQARNCPGARGPTSPRLLGCRFACPPPMWYARSQVTLFLHSFADVLGLSATAEDGPPVLAGFAMPEVKAAVIHGEPIRPPTTRRRSAPRRPRLVRLPNHIAPPPPSQCR